MTVYLSHSNPRDLHEQGIGYKDQGQDPKVSEVCLSTESEDGEAAAAVEAGIAHAAVAVYAGALVLRPRRAADWKHSVRVAGEEGK